MKKVVEWIRRIEKYFLALLVLGISFFSIGQILLRRFFRVPLWMDSMAALAWLSCLPECCTIVLVFPLPSRNNVSVLCSF